RRTKRGLINIFGSAIKAITGNLDNEDGRKLQAQITKLQDQEKRQKILIDEQISLATIAIEKFNKTISNIVINQQIFKRKITEIEEIINRTISTRIEVYPLMHIHALFLQIIT